MGAHPDFARQWLDQWRNAARELARVHDEELRALSASAALSASDALLDLARPPSPGDARWTHSGLIEQQRLFMRVRAR